MTDPDNGRTLGVGATCGSAMTGAEIEDLWGSIAEAETRRAEQLPTEQHCLRAMFDAYLRLKDLGWNDMMYAPKDGQVVDSISVGSTGIHPANYSGEWPEGRWWVHDAGDLWPGTPAMYRKTPAEIARWTEFGRKFRDTAPPRIQGRRGVRLWPRKPAPLRKEWQASRFRGDQHLCSDDEKCSPVVAMSFGYYGELFCRFEDGRSTCVWPTGEPVSPNRVPLRKLR